MSATIPLRLSPHSAIDLFPLRVHQEHGSEQYVVGRPEIGSYVVMSGDGMALVRLLDAKQTLGQARAALATQFGVPDVRIGSFLDTLLAAGFVRAVDGSPLADTAPRRRYHLRWLKREHVAWLFAKPAIAAYLLLAAGGVAVLVSDPGYLPRPRDLFAAPTYASSLLLAWGLSGLTVAKHELAHLVAARYVGTGGSFALGNRWFFPVAETDLTDLWLVDRGRRYLAYVAGMASDVLQLCVVLIALWLHDAGLVSWPALVDGALRFTVLVVCLGLVWQLNVLLRTDLYYVLANFFDCKNLSADAHAFVKRALGRLLGRGDPGTPSGVSAREMRVLRWYGLCLAAGTAAVVLVGVAAAVGVVQWVRAGTPDRDLPPVDYGGLALTLALTASWLVWAWLAKRRRRPRLTYRFAMADAL